MKLGIGDQQIQTTFYKRDKQQVSLHSTGNYIQYPATNLNGNEYDNELIYTYIYKDESVYCIPKHIVNQLYFNLKNN